jgi:hypothetical protein
MVHSKRTFEIATHLQMKMIRHYCSVDWSELLYMFGDEKEAADSLFLFYVGAVITAMRMLYYMYLLVILDE